MDAELAVARYASTSPLVPREETARQEVVSRRGGGAEETVRGVEGAEASRTPSFDTCAGKCANVPARGR